MKEDITTRTMNPNDSFALPKHGGHPLKDARKEAIFAELHSLLGSGLEIGRAHV